MGLVEEGGREAGQLAVVSVGWIGGREGGGGDSEKGEVELVFCSCDVCVPFCG